MWEGAAASSMPGCCSAGDTLAANSHLSLQVSTMFNTIFDTTMNIIFDNNPAQPTAVPQCYRRELVGRFLLTDTGVINPIV